MTYRKLLLAMLAGCVAFPGTAAAADIQEKLRDWTISCNADRACDASIAVTDIERPVSLLLRRDPTIGAPIDIVWKFQSPPPIGSRIRLQLNDVDYAISGEVVRVRPENEVWWPGYEPGEKLIQMLRQSQVGTVTLTLADSTDQDEGSVSLNGATASLALMDFVQRRLDRTDAAVVAGAVAANVPSREFYGLLSDPPVDPNSAEQLVELAPNAPQSTQAAAADTAQADDQADATATALPENPGTLFARAPFKVRLRTQLPAGMVRTLAEDYFCRTTELLQDSPAIAYPVDADRTLWQVPCNTTAFHQTQMFVESDRQSASALVVHTFDYPPDQAFDAETDTVDPQFDSLSGRLTSFVKSRSQGDCGIFAAYTWTGDGFDLLEYRQKSDCDGAIEDPETYPLLWSRS